MLKLDLSRDAGDFLANLPGTQFKQVVSAMLTLLKDPQPQDCRPLTGMADFYRVEAGECRIVFRVDGGMMYVPMISKRNDNDVHRRLERKL